MIKNEKEFKEYALDHYINEHCLGLNEFEADLKSIFLIKRLFKRFLLGDEINGTILVNLFIALYNVFPEDEVFENILIYKIEDYYYGTLKAVLKYMNVKITTDELTDTTVNIELLRFLCDKKHKYK